MKQTLTLNEAWKKCIASWRKIVKMGGDIRIAKFTCVPDDVEAHCYFCEYDKQNRIEDAPVCSKCPGKAVYKKFNCLKGPHTYINYPKEFLENILELDKERKAKK